MKALVLSDLHSEFYYRQGATWDFFIKHHIETLPSADILIIAGDAGNCVSFSEIIKAIIGLDKYQHILHVPGNHEFYLGSIPSVLYIAEQLEKEEPTYHCLYNTYFSLPSGTRICGTPMFFPRGKNTDRLQWALNDFTQIENYAFLVHKENAKAVDFLKSNVRKGDIVVTHHAPSYRSVPAKYAGQLTNEYYVCDMEDWIKVVRPKLWIHGHMHASSDYKIGPTRVIANPFGYGMGMENVMGFDYRKFVEVQ